MAEGLYLTKDEYVARFGEPEAIRVTDDQRTGQIDDEAMNRAIADASADIDSYLAGRYALPLSPSVPRVVVSLAAALTREKLHVAFPTEAVTGAADRARKQLLDYSTGKAVLVGVDGLAPEAGSTGGGPSGIRVIAPGRTFTSDVLNSFAPIPGTR